MVLALIAEHQDLFHQTALILGVVLHPLDTIISHIHIIEHALPQILHDTGLELTVDCKTLCIASPHSTPGPPHQSVKPCLFSGPSQDTIIAIMI